MSAGFNNITDANKYGIDSFRIGQEGFTYLTDFLVSKTDDQLGDIFGDVFEKSIYDASEFSALKTRISTVFEELNKKATKGDLSQQEITARSVVESCVEAFNSSEVAEKVNEERAKLASKVQFGEFTTDYFTRRNMFNESKDLQRLDASIKVDVHVIQQELNKILEKDSSAVATYSRLKGYQKGDNFDVFTKLLDNLTLAVELAVTAFIDSQESEDSIDKLKSLLETYKNAFAKIGAKNVPDQNTRELIQTNIRKIEEILNYESEDEMFEVLGVAAVSVSEASKEEALFDQIFAGGVDGIGKKHKKLISKEKFFTKGLNFYNLGSLLHSPEGVAAIKRKLESFAKTDRDLVVKMLNRFSSIYGSEPYHKKESPDVGTKITEILAENLDQIGELIDNLDEKEAAEMAPYVQAFKASQEAPKPSSSSSAPNVEEVSVPTQTDSLKTQLNDILTAGPDKIGTKAWFRNKYNPGENYQKLLTIFSAERSGVLIIGQEIFGNEKTREALKAVVERTLLVIENDASIPLPEKTVIKNYLNGHLLANIRANEPARLDDIIKVDDTIDEDN